ncbi:NUDIX domain-containing protein [Zalerion maritima]|uniref:NUDIX domain-containing protein n=1 Tax=Zalerion maritima TaxID=339359 RepID=A0AAD5RLD2_9PEZI|nr:NUDIX domain-containing protein [Zalerion maritima]
MAVDIDLDALAKKRTFHGSDKFIISCGTVTIDPKVGKVLLIYNSRYNIYQLPKGRKNIGEDWLTCALRETFEESGVKPSPLPLKVDTRATPAKGHTAQVQLTTDIFNTEPIAQCTFPDPISNCWKTVFWFVATGDSAAPQAKGTQEDWEKFETVWKPAAEAVELLRFADDGDTVLRAIELVKRSGVDIANTDNLHHDLGGGIKC